MNRAVILKSLAQINRALKFHKSEFNKSEIKILKKNKRYLETELSGNSKS
ncbi:MAG: hypothetical protein ACFFAO_06435 [Candidatus Hermodarchaeota archaeon]